MLANPPFGVEWKKVETAVEDEHETLGFDGRFGAGLPRINDGSLLFLQHMISQDEAGRARAARGSPSCSTAPRCSPARPGRGESEIRRWIIENDWLEGIVALPDQLFYNTGISTYFWVAHQPQDAPSAPGKVVLSTPATMWTKMRKSLGDKRKYVTDEQIAEITRLYADALASPPTRRRRTRR